MAKRSYRAMIAPVGRSATPVIDLEKCSGCGLCVSICPLGALEIKNKKASAVVGMKMGKKTVISCFGCRDCMAVCAEGAISIDGSMVIEKGYYQSMYPDRKIKPPEPLGPGKKFSEITDQLTDIEKVIYRRRSNRIYKKAPVPREMLERILEAGRFAPSAGNNQPVRFIVVDDRAMIDEIEQGVSWVLKQLRKSYLDRGPAPRFFVRLYGLSKPGEIDLRPMQAIAATYREGSELHLFHHAPCLILVLGDRRGVGDFHTDCGIAAQNVVLAAHALGLGTCYVGLIKPINLLGKLKKKLGIEYPYQVATSITVGFPRVKQDQEVPREKTPVTWFGPGDAKK